MSQLKSKAIGLDHTLLSDSLTNDPVAVIRKVPGYTKQFAIKWHPDALKIWDAASSIHNRNFPIEDSMKGATNTVHNAYFNRVQQGKYDNPVPVRAVGSRTKQDADGQTRTYDEYHVYDNTPEKKHVANLLLNASYRSSPDEKAARYSYYAQLEFVGDHVPNEHQQEILKKKHPETSGHGALERVKTWLDLKDKEPLFVGSHQTKMTKVWNTRLKPKEALDAYLKHISSKDDGTRKIDRLSDTYATSVAAKYGNAQHEIFDARTPKTLIHHSIAHYPEQSYSTSPLNEVIDEQ